MKMTLVQITICNAALENLAKTPRISARLSMTLGLMFRKLLPFVEEYNKARDNLIKTYGRPDSMPGQFTFNAENPEDKESVERCRSNYETFQRELQDLLSAEHEIEVVPIPLSALEKEETERKAEFNGESILSLAGILISQ